MKKRFDIDIQKFADQSEDQTQAAVEVDDVLDAENTDEVIEVDEGNEEEERALLRQKLKVMDSEKAIEARKVLDLEEKIAKQTEEMESLKKLMISIAENTKPKKKAVAKTSKAEVDEINAREILSHTVSKLEKQIAERDERDFIRQKVAEKPWIAEAVKNQKISTENEYIRNILPMEDTFKEMAELKKKISRSSDRDIISEYGLGTRVSKDTKVAKIRDTANQLGKSIIDDILA